MRKSSKTNNSKYNDYFLVNMAFAWLKELKHKKGRNVILSSLVNQALTDILSGKVTLSDIKKRIEGIEEKTKSEKKEKK